MYQYKLNVKMNSIRPIIHTSMLDAANHLIQHGWTVINAFDQHQTEIYKHDLLTELQYYSDDHTFFTDIPRVLGGMIKSGHLSMSRTLHSIRKNVRPKYHSVIKELPNEITQRFLDHPIPETPEELNCNPDALFVSSGIPPIFPPRAGVGSDGLWWHIDASRERTFVQSSVILDNPEGSEEFCVISGSHNYFYELQERVSDTNRMVDDWFMLDASDTQFLKDHNCEPVSMLLPPGAMVLWFSTTVHTVKPPKNHLISPRIQIYVCFGTFTHLDVDVQKDIKNMKTSAILFGTSCRHLPYPCSFDWQEKFGGGYVHLYYRDLIYPHKLEIDMPWIFGWHSLDFTDDELSVYGITAAELKTNVQNWNQQYKYLWLKKMN